MYTCIYITDIRTYAYVHIYIYDILISYINQFKQTNKISLLHLRSNSLPTCC